MNGEYQRGGSCPVGQARAIVTQFLSKAPEDDRKYPHRGASVSDFTSSTVAQKVRWLFKKYQELVKDADQTGRDAVGRILLTPKWAPCEWVC